MINVRKTSNILPFDKVSSSSETSADKNTSVTSPFAAKPAQSLKSLTERKSRPLTEEQRLALLQRALQPFANEARSHLPVDVSSVEKKVRKKMLEEGFSEVIATEAGEETVDALLGNRRRVAKARSQNKT